MSGVFRHADGATPLTWEEMQDVIPVHIAYRRDLDEAEQANILRGQDWALGRRRAILDEKFIRILNKQLALYFLLQRGMPMFCVLLADNGHKSYH